MLSFALTTHNELEAFYGPASLLNTDRRLKQLKDINIPIQALIDLRGPVLLKIRRNGRSFNPDPKSTEEWVFPNWRGGLLVDALAWNGRSLASFNGREAILGDSALLDWDDHLKPLRIFQDPFDWLAAEGEGVIIINDESAWRILDRFTVFEADDIKHSIHLNRVLQRPRRKIEIRVPESQVA